MNKVVKGGSSDSGSNPDVKPVAAASVVGVTPVAEVSKPVAAPPPPPVRPALKAQVALAAPAKPACSTCGDTKRVKFTEKKRKLVSVGPCPDCVKA